MIASQHPRRDTEAQLRDEPRGAQHSQRVVAEGHRRRRRGIQHARPQCRQAVQRIDEFVSARGCYTHGHRVHGEVAAHQIVAERVAEADLRVARYSVVPVGPKRGDLQAVTILLGADGAELDAGVPQRVGPRPQQLLQLFGPRVGGEVQVVAQPPQHGVAHRTADQIELVSGASEHAAELAQDVGVAVQRDRGGGQQLGILGVFGHGERIVRLVRPDPAAHYRRVRPERLSTPATIAKVSDGENPQPRRRRGRRRGRRSAGSGEAKSGNEATVADTPAKAAKAGQRRPARRAAERLRTVHETSAGGLGHRQHRPPSGGAGRRADRPDGPAGPDAVVAAQGPHRTR